MLPTEFYLLRARAEQLRGKARERGSITVEWVVIAGALFLAAVWAAALIISVVKERGSKIK